MEAGGRREKAVGAKGSRLRLRKKADPARWSRKEEGVEGEQALTPRVYKEGCPPSD